MKKQLLLLTACLMLTAVAQAQDKKFKGYAIGFYNLENLFDTQHDEGHNDYQYLPDGSNKWNELKYSHKLANMSKVLSEMGTDRIPNGCAVIGVSEVENAHCMADLCEQPALKAKNFQFVHIEGNGLNRLIEQKAIGNPNGIPKRSVTAKIRQEILKPFNK